MQGRNHSSWEVLQWKEKINLTENLITMERLWVYDATVRTIEKYSQRTLK